MIKIDALSLNLPAGYQGRAESITRHIGQALAGHQTGRSVTFDRLPPINVNITPGQSNRAIGTHIAGAIHSRLNNKGGGGHG